MKDETDFEDARDEHLCVIVRRATLPVDAAQGPARVRAMRTQALAALAHAASLQSARLGALEHDALGAPRPSNGWHWSIAHTSLGELCLVAAAVSREPVGVDAEAQRLPSDDVVRCAMDDDEERALAPGTRAARFTRAWTAKEAVLKKLGLGLAALSQVRVEDADGDALVLWHGGTRHAVESISLPPFTVSVSGRARDSVRWEIDSPGDVRGRGAAEVAT